MIKKLILFILLVGLIPIASAVSFNSPSGTTGTIGNGNGYFDNEGTLFNYTTDRNIYVLAELTSIWITEPMNRGLSITSDIELMTMGNSSFRYAMVASDGYLYYIDLDGIKRRQTRNDANVHVANDTGFGGSSVLIYSSSSVYKLVEYNSRIYFLEGLALKYFELDDLLIVSATTLSLSACVGTNTAVSINFDITSNGTVIIDRMITNGAIDGYFCHYSLVDSTLTKFNTSALMATGGGTWHGYSSIIPTDNYIYINTNVTDLTVKGGYENVYYIGNGSIKSVNTYITSPVWNNTISLGGYTTVAMYASSINTYNVFNFIEAGNLHAFNPAVLTYSQSTINSLYDTYYNNSKFVIQIDVEYTANVTQKEIYTHRIDLIDPNSAVIGTFNTVNVCESTGALDWLLDPNKLYNCVAVATAIDINDFITNPAAAVAGANTIEFSQITDWTNGTYSVSLIEVPPNAELDSDSFIVLAQSGNITTAIPQININSPQNQIAIGYFDGWVSLFGMGINDVSKLYFSLLVITIVALIALAISRNGMIAMVLSFAPYIFFTFIGYIPKWIFIIVIILMAIVSKVFR